MSATASRILRRRLTYGRRCLSTTAQTVARDVRVVEVGPRDGLQHEPNSLDLETKLDLIRRLSKTGLENIEAGSLVSKKWVPQVY